MQPKRRDLLTEAEAQERDHELRAAGIQVVTDPPGAAVITLLTKTTGEIVPLLGLRPTPREPADSTEAETERP